MEIDVSPLQRWLNEELQTVANRLLKGVEDWEEYLAAQARATVLMEVSETISETVKNQRAATGEAPNV